MPMNLKSSMKSGVKSGNTIVYTPILLLMAVFWLWFFFGFGNIFGYGFHKFGLFETDTSYYIDNGENLMSLEHLDRFVPLSFFYVFGAPLGAFLLWAICFTGISKSISWETAKMIMRPLNRREELVIAVTCLVLTFQMVSLGLYSQLMVCFLLLRFLSVFDKSKGAKTSILLLVLIAMSHPKGIFLSCLILIIIKFYDTFGFIWERYADKWHPKSTALYGGIFLLGVFGNAISAFTYFGMTVPKTLALYMANGWNKLRLVPKILSLLLLFLMVIDINGRTLPVALLVMMPAFAATYATKEKSTRHNFEGIFAFEVLLALITVYTYYMLGYVV